MIQPCLGSSEQNSDMTAMRRPHCALTVHTRSFGTPILVTSFACTLASLLDQVVNFLWNAYVVSHSHSWFKMSPESFAYKLQITNVLRSLSACMNL